MKNHRIAVVGISCRYPDANSPDELWQNVLAGRRAFRTLPDERMNKDDYYSPDPTAPDRFYSGKAAVIEGFDFDRVKYRVAGSTYRATDLTHWLALDTAARALADAGFPEGAGLNRKNTGVVVGNSLTGEFSRASIMRLRWPYVRRTVGAALREQGWDDAALDAFMADLEVKYKEPFAPIDEDTLAGGLANTIAGRICNHYDFGGGGYTVDGACSSSLLSVSTMCTALANGQLDTAIAGGVDLSIDPFEVIGFAKTGALAKGEMRVYDEHSNGFWPGEGCGMLVLMREEDAIAQNRPIYATIVGWGYSSDGKGGITRPEAAGHELAIARAYQLAGFGIDTVGYLEGHGTGTAVGDATEIQALSGALRTANPDGEPTFLSTLKGNIGHTKAAAGVGGLIKAILAVHHQIVPPATSHIDPHPILREDRPALTVPSSPQLWPADQPVRAGVSSMGFGGINTHVVIEQAVDERRVEIGDDVQQLVSSRQDCELLLLDAESTADLRGLAAQLSAMCQKLSFAELADLSVTLQSRLADRPVRAAVLATSPEEATAGFAKLLVLLDNGARSALDSQGTVFLGGRGRAPRIGFLFPGQGAGRRGDGGAIRRRFRTVDALYNAQQLPTDGDLVNTAIAQPRIVTSSVAGLRVLAKLGIQASAAAGHSLGELSALHWAGALTENDLFGIATARGRIMAELDGGDGTMATIVAPADQVEPLLRGTPVVIAGYNSPQQTVISGPAAAVEQVCATAVAGGLNAMRIAVSHAFHSDLVAPAAGQLREVLSGVEFGPLSGRVHSTVTGAELADDTDLSELLSRQVRDAVRFSEAVGALAEEVDLLLEVGPGKVLRALATDIAPMLPTVSVETDSPSLTGLFRAVAAAYVLGAPVNHAALSEGRFTRELPLDKEFRFFASPCEQAPSDELGNRPPALRPTPVVAPAGPVAEPVTTQVVADPATNALDVLRRLAAERAELPLEAVSANSNPLDELHLSSITVGQIVNQASRELGLAAPVATSSYATSTLAQLAQMLEQLGESAVPGEVASTTAPGVAPWVRPFAVEWRPSGFAAAPATASAAADWQLFATEQHPLATQLHEALQRAELGGGGVLLCLPTDCDEQHVGLMLQAARTVLALPEPVRFVVVGDRRGAAGLAKTLCLEAPQVTTTVVSLPLSTDRSDDRLADVVSNIVADVAATQGFLEVRYTADGERLLPVLNPIRPVPAAERQPVLNSSDVLVVTGGGKGITAESALAIAIDTGAAIGLLGRSNPAQDAELSANLDRMAAAGVRYHYVSADVTSTEEVKTAVEEIRERFGEVTAILHGAGRNEPGSLTALTESAFERTLAPKIAGLQAVLAATNPNSLKLLVTFGSIIGRAGLRGEADYATANDWMTELTYQFAEQNPNCKCLALEWSVWSGSGMGERLGVLESLIREGISPIPTEQGIALLNQLLAEPNAPVAIVVMGRAEGLPTITLQEQDVPLLRFIDRTQVHYPGIELVVDADLTGTADLYLPDHLLDGDLLFPAVLGMEAMTQTAQALTGRTGSPVLTDMEFLRPIVIPVQGKTTIRIAALVDAAGDVDVVIRSSETDFQADHFRATLRYSQSLPISAGTPATGALLPIHPDPELYGPVLFQGTRFQRLIGYRALAATGCVAEISNVSSHPWFAGYLPHDLVLGDPGTRDTMMHALQCCVPDATLLPAGLERLYLADADTVRELGQLTLHARERSRDGDTYIYDLDVRDPAGVLVERWEGLKLRAVRKLDGSGPWLASLLGPYLERRTEPVLGRWLHCAVYPDGAESPAGIAARRELTGKAVDSALGAHHTLSYRPDGKPTMDSGLQVSSSHGAGVTFVVAAEGDPVACDVESAVPRTAEDWTGLLGSAPSGLANLLVTETGEDFAVSATRVWGAIECLRKAGRASVEPLTLAEPPNGSWVVLNSGSARIATFVTALSELAEPVVFTMLTETRG